MTEPDPDTAPTARSGHGGPVRVLVTAFGAFPGAPTNPSEAIVRGLRLRERAFARAGIVLSTAVMPVQFAGVEGRLRALLARQRPDVVLHLGLAGRRRVVSIETRARNRLTVLHPDATGATNISFCVDPGGPFVRKARWNAARLVTAMQAAGVAAHSSIDAGDYLCNQTLYLMLRLFEGPAGFIHVPRLRRRGRASSLPDLTQATNAVARAVILCAHDAANSSARP